MWSVENPNYFQEMPLQAEKLVYGYCFKETLVGTFFLNMLQEFVD